MTDRERFNKRILDCFREMQNPIYDDPKDGPIKQLIEKHGVDGKLILKSKESYEPPAKEEGE